MKVWRLIITICLPGILMFSSCGDDPVQKTVGPIKVLIPWTDGSSKYKFREVEIKTITNLGKVQGPYVEFHYQPLITADGIDGSRPRARWVKDSDDRYIPADYLSTQMFTIYAHMEQLAELDRRMGIFNKEHWPRKIGVTLPIEGDLSAQSAQFRNNAFYHSGDNSIVIQPYRLPDLPLSVNAGVLAHEHFHSHFDKLLQKPLMQLRPEYFEMDNGQADIDPYYFYFVTRALNEGLADYWGWIYSGHADFVGKSLASIDEVRNLKGQSHKIEGPFYRNFISREGRMRGHFTQEDDARHLEEITRIAYSSGANLARVLREISGRIQRDMGLTSEEVETYMIKRIFKTLKLLRDDLIRRQNFDDFAIVTFFELFLQTVDEPTEEECGVVLSYIEWNDAHRIIETCKLAPIDLAMEGVLLDGAFP